MSLTLLSIGDSVVWGQGLAEAGKFRLGLCQDLHAALGVDVVPLDRSHSGAALAPDPGDWDPTLADWPGEVPRFCPSVGAQWEHAIKTGPFPDLVLVNGGINDVGLATICSLSDRQAEIAELAAAKCGQAMRQFLERLVFASGRPRVIVTGYYAAISRASHLGSLLDAIPHAEALLQYLTGIHQQTPRLAELGEALSLPHLLARPSLLGVLAGNWETFAKCANASLREAAGAVNGALGQTRVWFVDPDFGVDHAMFTDAPYLFNPSLLPQDSAAAVRLTACPTYYPVTARPFECIVCLAAPTGHPNVDGARRYRQRLHDAALPEVVAQLQQEGVGGQTVAMWAPTAVGAGVGTVSLVSPYDTPIPPGSLRYLKGQLHCHWYDDGQLPHLLGWGQLQLPKFFDLSRHPDEVARSYRDLGYDFLAFTEHNVTDVLNYTRQHGGYGTAGACLVPPTPVVSTSPTFTEVLRSEELTAHYHHVLAFGVPCEIDQPPGQVDTPFLDLVRQAAPCGSAVVFLPHPRQYYHGAYSNFGRDIISGVGPTTPFSAISVRTSASAFLHSDSLGLWDVLLNQQIRTHTSDGTAILLPAYSEDDYAPLGLGNTEILRPGSTWIAVEVDASTDPWSQPGEGDNDARHAALLQALQSGRWWTYWVDWCEPWLRNCPYPHLAMSVDGASGAITVSSDLPLAELSFVTSRGMPSAEKHANVPADHAVVYQCRGDEIYVRVAAEYRDTGAMDGYRLRVYGNPVWVRRPEPLGFAPTVLAPPPPPTVTLPPDLNVLQGTTTISLQIEGEVIHAPVSVDDWVVAYAKPVAGDAWQAEVDVTTFPDGPHVLRAEVVDREGRPARDWREIEVRGGRTAPALTIDATALPAAPPAGPVTLTGQVALGPRQARPLAIVAQFDGQSTFAGAAQGTAWSCQVPPGTFTPGPHTLQVTALYETQALQSAEVAFVVA